jgi:hypothetical protein
MSINSCYIFTSVGSKVGSICCRLENKDDKTKLYLMTMGVLAVSLGALQIILIHNIPKAISLQVLGIAELGLDSCIRNRPRKAQDR